MVIGSSRTPPLPRRFYVTFVTAVFTLGCIKQVINPPISFDDSSPSTAISTRRRLL